jgi:gamma-glutamylcyclotransferase (GGCT)/AIG2-like uncharacterized protein YtfP
VTDAGDRFVLFVNGTLMRGGALHRNLDGATFLGEGWTAPVYRLYSINDRHPGMIRVPSGGVAVRGELYEVSSAIWERVAAQEPANLYRGSVELSDGRTVDGILYPRDLAEGRHRDISEFGDWREYSRTLSRGMRSQ